MKGTHVVLAMSLILPVPSMAWTSFSDGPSIYSRQGKYLGNLNNNRYDSNSVSNPYGRYGSRYSSDSINNPYGRYGSRYSSDSPRNPYGNGLLLLDD